MSRYPKYLYRHLSNFFCFYDEKEIWRTLYFLNCQITKLIGLDNPCPVVFAPWKRCGMKGPINILGRLAGFNSEVHKARLDLYEELSRSVRWMNLLVVVLALYLFDVANRFTKFELSDTIFNIVNTANQRLATEEGSLIYWYIYFPVILGFVLVFLLVAYFFIVGVPLKLISRLRDANWSEVICLKTSLYILVDLSRHDVLTNPMKRRVLLNRMDRLATVTKLIPLSNPNASMRSKSVDDYFKKVSLFIGERKSWAYSPIETTLDDLRNDFYELTHIYILGNYGAFSRNLTDISGYIVEDLNQSSKSPYLNRILKPIGFLMPLAVIGLIILIPDDKLPFDQTIEPTLVLIFISWLLLSIDQYLDLGVVEGLIDLAKGIKDLK